MSPLLFRHFIAIAALLLSLQTHAETDLASAIALTQEAVAGKRNADDAVQALEALLPAATPDDRPRVLAWLGTAQTLQGRDAWMPWTKLKATERGLDNIDKALRLLADRPVDFSVLEVRLVAIASFIGVPDAIFHRAAQGRKLLADSMVLPAFATAHGALRAGFHRQAALLAKQDKDARKESEQLKLLLAADGSGSYAAAAQARLKEITP